MRTHTASELRFIGDILGPDSVVRAQKVRCGVDNLSGRRLEQAQLTNSEVSAMIVFRKGDAALLDKSCYVVVDGVTHVVDYLMDSNEPRPGMWLEVYCHIEGDGK
jgi:hypothetical protein